MSRRLVVVGVVIALCAGCGHDKRAMKAVGTRASFEFSCPQDELDLVVLSTVGALKQASQIGATGCGHRAVYVYFASTNSWVADTDITTTMTQREEAYRARQASEERAADVERRFEQQEVYQRGVNE